MFGHGVGEGVVDFLEFGVFLDEFESHHAAFVVRIWFRTGGDSIGFVVILVDEFDPVDVGGLPFDFFDLPFNATENR